MKQKLYVYLAMIIQARINCIKDENTIWIQTHEETLLELSQHLPHGSGIESAIDVSNSLPNKIILNVSYHHMNENGYYDGYTYHIIKITPDLSSGFNLSISGKNRNDIKEYLYECFYTSLNELISLS